MPSRPRTGSGSASSQAQYERQWFVHVASLVDGEVADLITDGARVDGADHLAEHACRFVSQGNLGMEARRGADLEVGQTTMVERARKSSAWTITA